MKFPRLITSLLSNPLVYRLHASGVDRAKLAAISRIRDDFTGLKVLDLGCGPGNFTGLFSGADYTGVDINERYIALARKKYPRQRFVAGDAGKVDWGDGFDVILINSFFHHIPDDEVSAVLKKAVVSLDKGGIILVQEPLIPEKDEWYHRLMMRLDRGNYFRTLNHWKSLLRQAGLSPKKIEFYHLRIMGIRGYHMVSLCLIDDSDL